MQTNNTDPIYEFYTNQPLPVPMYDLELTREIFQDESVRHAEHHLLWPHENVVDLDHQFDLIMCTGVLHHLVDPDAGLRALPTVLQPDGAMFLMVYAPYGRSLFGFCK